MEDGLTLREEVTLRYIANASDNVTKFKGKDWVECSCGTLMPVLKAARNTVYRTLKSLESKQYILRSPQRLHGNLSIASFCLTDKARTLFFGFASDQKIHTYNKAKSFMLINHNKSNGGKTAERAKRTCSTPKASNQLGLFCESKPMTTVVQDMFKIWREELGSDESLNKRLSRFMVACYQKVFKSLERWREYVRKLSRSGYIMNKIRKCGYFLRWALSFKVINKIYEGGFGVPTESGSNQSSSNQRSSTESGSNQSWSTESWEERMTKANRIAADILSDSVMKIYKRYENDREARELIAEFIECYGKYEAVTVFSNAGIHLRGKRLRLYFGNLFHMNRFLIHCRYDRFIEYCEKRYDFKVELESSQTEEMPQIGNSLKFA